MTATSSSTVAPLSIDTRSMPRDLSFVMRSPSREAPRVIGTSPTTTSSATSAIEMVGMSSNMRLTTSVKAWTLRATSGWPGA